MANIPGRGATHNQASSRFNLAAREADGDWLDTVEAIDGPAQKLRTSVSLTLGEHIEIGLVPGDGLWPALADPSQLESAVLNLCLNARDAMPAGGRLVIETGNVRLEREYVAQNPDVEAGDYVMVAVSDTGTGIEPALVGRVFEPFFTTKDFGSGSGLGLSMVYGFVRQSGGNIRIRSTPGRTGRLFAEFALALAGAVLVSGFVALTLSPPSVGEAK